MGLLIPYKSKTAFVTYQVLLPPGLLSYGRSRCSEPPAYLHNPFQCLGPSDLDMRPSGQIPTSQSEQEMQHMSLAGMPGPSTTAATGAQPTESIQFTETQGTEVSTVDANRRASNRNPNPDDNDRPIHQILDRWDVAALIINEMVGTGIFTSPPLVLRFTQSKSEAMFLWILGLVYTYLW